MLEQLLTAVSKCRARGDWVGALIAYRHNVDQLKLGVGSAADTNFLLSRLPAPRSFLSSAAPSSLIGSLVLSTPPHQGMSLLMGLSSGSHNTLARTVYNAYLVKSQKQTEEQEQEQTEKRSVVEDASFEHFSPEEKLQQRVSGLREATTGLFDDLLAARRVATWEWCLLLSREAGRQGLCVSESFLDQTIGTLCSASRCQWEDAFQVLLAQIRAAEDIHTTATSMASTRTTTTSTNVGNKGDGERSRTVVMRKKTFPSEAYKGIHPRHFAAIAQAAALRGQWLQSLGIVDWGVRKFYERNSFHAELMKQVPRILVAANRWTHALTLLSNALETPDLFPPDVMFVQHILDALVDHRQTEAAMGVWRTFGLSTGCTATDHLNVLALSLCRTEHDAHRAADLVHEDMLESLGLSANVTTQLVRAEVLAVQGEWERALELAREVVMFERFHRKRSNPTPSAYLPPSSSFSFFPSSSSSSAASSSGSDAPLASVSRTSIYDVERCLVSNLLRPATNDNCSNDGDEQHGWIHALQLHRFIVGNCPQQYKWAIFSSHPSNVATTTAPTKMAHQQSESAITQILNHLVSTSNTSALTSFLVDEATSRQQQQQQNQQHNLQRGSQVRTRNRTSTLVHSAESHDQHSKSKIHHRRHRHRRPHGSRSSLAGLNWWTAEAYEKVPSALRASLLQVGGVELIGRLCVTAAIPLTAKRSIPDANSTGGKAALSVFRFVGSLPPEAVDVVAAVLFDPRNADFLTQLIAESVVELPATMQKERPTTKSSDDDDNDDEGDERFVGAAAFVNHVWELAYILFSNFAPFHANSSHFGVSLVRYLLANAQEEQQRGISASEALCCVIEKLYQPANSSGGNKGALSAEDERRVISHAWSASSSSSSSSSSLQNAAMKIIERSCQDFLTHGRSREANVPNEQRVMETLPSFVRFVRGDDDSLLLLSYANGFKPEIYPNPQSGQRKDDTIEQAPQDETHLMQRAASILTFAMECCRRWHSFRLGQLLCTTIATIEEEAARTGLGESIVRHHISRPALVMLMEATSSGDLWQEALTIFGGLFQPLISEQNQDAKSLPYHLRDATLRNDLLALTVGAVVRDRWEQALELCSAMCFPANNKKNNSQTSMFALTQKGVGNIALGLFFLCVNNAKTSSASASATAASSLPLDMSSLCDRFLDIVTNVHAIDAEKQRRSELIVTVKPEDLSSSRSATSTQPDRRPIASAQLWHYFALAAWAAMRSDLLMGILLCCNRKNNTNDADEGNGNNKTWWKFDVPTSVQQSLGLRELRFLLACAVYSFEKQSGGVGVAGATTSIAASLSAEERQLVLREARRCVPTQEATKHEQSLKAPSQQTEVATVMGLTQREVQNAISRAQMQYASYFGSSPTTATTSEIIPTRAAIEFLCPKEVFGLIHVTPLPTPPPQQRHTHKKTKEATSSEEVVGSSSSSSSTFSSASEALNNAINRKSWEAALTIIPQIIHSNLHAARKAAAVARHCNNNWVCACIVARFMEQHALTDEVTTTGKLSAVLARNRRWEECLAIATKWPAVDAFVYTECLYALEMTPERRSLGLWAFARMRAQGITPTTQVYNRLFSLLCFGTRDQAQFALKLLDAKRRHPEAYDSSSDVRRMSDPRTPHHLVDLCDPVAARAAEVLFLHRSEIGWFAALNLVLPTLSTPVVCAILSQAPEGRKHMARALLYEYTRQQLAVPDAVSRCLSRHIDVIDAFCTENDGEQEGEGEKKLSGASSPSNEEAKRKNELQRQQVDDLLNRILG